MSQFKPINFITHPRYLDHDTGGGFHPEIPERLVAIDKRLQAGPLLPILTQTLPRAAERQWLLTSHSNSYLFRFEEQALSGRSYLDHSDNQMCYDTYEISLLAAGAGLTGVDLLESEATDLVFCSIRPPGHHAERGLAMGFCFLNNVAIAANYWRQVYGRQKILIIDWDAHHGNGIQTAFVEDQDVLYISIHEHPTFSFPGTGFAEDTGTGAGKGATLNIPLLPGAGDKACIAALDKKVEPAVEAFQPQAMIVAAGFDGHALDDMSGLTYSTDLFGRLGEYMTAWARTYCRSKVLTILEGGYHLEALGASVEKYLAGLASSG
jgi:acetoin utilization deacetylase AcuC-like enzyme